MRAVARAVAGATVLISAAGCLSAQKDLPAHVVAAAADARVGGTVTVGITAPTSIDPSLVPPADSAGTLVVRTMCDSLLATDPVSGRLAPDLAASWRVTGGGTLVTLRLRRGLRFANGRRVTSADVTASLARVARPSVASPNATMLDEISGWSALQQDEDKQHGHLTGMSAPDPRSVQVALSTADAQWPRVLATAVGVVLPASVAKHDNGFGAFSNKPTCVGPYRLSAPWRPGDGSITLLRSASYDGGSPRSTRAGRGWADRVVFRIYPTAAAVSTAYRRGEVDVAQLAPSQTDAERGLLGAAEVRTAGDSTIGYIGLPTSVPPFDDPAVRVALSMALDRDLIARRVYGGGRLPLLGVYPPTVGADIWRPHACSTAPAGGDVAAATRSLGARLTLLRGKTFPLYVDDEFANRALVAAVAAQWHRAFGVTFHIEGMPFEAYVQRAVAAPGFDGPFRLSYASASASAGDYARELLAGAAIGVSNATRFLDAKVEQLLRDDAAKQATARGFAALRAVEDEFCRQMPFVPVTVNEQVWAWRSDLGAAGGVQLDRATGLPLIREAFRKAA